MKILHTGLRVDDVELRERSGRVRVRHGKGGKYREVPLNVTVRKVLFLAVNRRSRERDL